jgi:hypothetical protein
MKIRAVVLLIAMFAAPAAQAADDRLVGKWDAIDQPGKWAEFRADGVFSYIYDTGRPPTILEVFWKTGWFSKLTLSMAHGGNGTDCKYSLKDDDLTVDNGSGISCLPHIKMAQKFKRAKAP